MERQIEQSREGKFVFRLLQDLKEKNLELEKLVNSPDVENKADLRSKIESAETYISDHKLEFVQFGSWNEHAKGAGYTSEIKAWFRATTEADHYFAFSAKFFGKTDNLDAIKLNWYNVKEYHQSMNFNFPPDRLTFANFFELSLFQMTALFLALAALLTSVLAFVDCLLKWKGITSKLWIIPNLLGLSPVQISLGSSIWTFKLASVVALPGGLQNPLFAAGFFVTGLDNTSSHLNGNVDGQVAYFSLPIAAVYFFRRFMIRRI